MEGMSVELGQDVLDCVAVPDPLGAAVLEGLAIFFSPIPAR